MVNGFRVRRRLGVAVAGGALALMLVACSGGSTGAAGSTAATASAAAAIIPSLIRDAFVTAAPNPNPGNTNALFDCAI